MARQSNDPTTWDFRYGAVRGLEVRKPDTAGMFTDSGGSALPWERVTGDDLLSMGSHTLRRVADTLDEVE